MASRNDVTISAIATPEGRGGIGIVRVSGAKARQIAESVCGKLPPARVATLTSFHNADGEVLDSGIALYFPKPDSFTGEDVLELQGHGGPQVLNAVLRLTLECGARLARPGEFTERAFLNDKLDLLQAEAIADLVNAGSEQAARSAMRSLQGVFSARINELVSHVTSLRTRVEAAIDFSDEDIEVLEQERLIAGFDTAQSLLQDTFRQARQGALLRQGITVVLTGAPNAGKSSLFNALVGNEAAIVTAVPGTTRDLVTQQCMLDGLPVQLTDTAGLGDSNDPVEQEGVRRARDAISKADLILLVVDGATMTATTTELIAAGIDLLADQQEHCRWLEHHARRLVLVINKIDLLPEVRAGRSSTAYQQQTLPCFHISATEQSGLAEIKSWLQTSCGFLNTGETGFIARARHLEALQTTRKHLNRAGFGVGDQLPLELIAEDLRLAQQALGSITGELSSDDLLGEIFSSFCIGK